MPNNVSWGKIVCRTESGPVYASQCCLVENSVQLGLKVDKFMPNIEWGGMGEASEVRRMRIGLK